ncbi:hypothetical protein JOD31_002369 [Methylopila capsulata]|uniref:Serine protease n=1 Tax=Methylopila capsulata TaxID=61654 RepID=A0A9W6IUB1_9HYPH|nr:trypsin-like peptidase domain-containing protein [Methylopila capsulata]MBM7852127.1 hypothetical protein [Methylopila capsulata]GLK56333.1 hypothetical protein GCM10008170_23520 [Methylopila capsulata]
MPKIPASYLNCTVYLYKSTEDAEIGKAEGGTGFFAFYPIDDSNKGYTCIVSNWHVAVRDGFSVARINSPDGGSDIIDLDPSEWYFQPGIDVAVAIYRHDHLRHKGSFVRPGDFITKEIITREEIGPGEDVFLIGRFVDHDGGKVNKPSVRFGNISMMHSKLINPTDKFSDMLCVDLRCRGGYSGSPVFVYRTPGFDLTQPPAKNLEQSFIMLDGVILLMMLGMLTSQFQETSEIRKGIKATQDQSEPPNVPEKDHVKILSGMSLVTPSWDIERVIAAAVIQHHRS